MNIFATRLHGLVQRRIEQGAYASESDLARRLGIQARRLNHYTQGRSEPDYEQLVRMARELQTHPNYLLGCSDDPEPRYLESVQSAGSLREEIADLKQAMLRMISGKILSKS